MTCGSSGTFSSAAMTATESILTSMTAECSNGRQATAALPADCGAQCVVVTSGLGCAGAGSAASQEGVPGHAEPPAADRPFAGCRSRSGCRTPRPRAWGCQAGCCHQPGLPPPPACTLNAGICHPDFAGAGLCLLMTYGMQHSCAGLWHAHS